MNEVLKAMEERRSVRRFKPDMPPKALLEQVVRAGTFAASGKNKQDVVMLVITDPELRNAIAEENRKIGGWAEGFDPFYGAPAMILVLAEKEEPNRVYDGSLVMGNLMLAAHTVGLATCWIHRAKQEAESGFLTPILEKAGISGTYEGIGHCAIGYPDGDIPQTPPRRSDRVFWL